MIAHLTALFTKYVRKCHNDKVKALMQRHEDAFKLIDCVTAGYATVTEQAKDILEPLMIEMQEAIGE